MAKKDTNIIDIDAETLESAAEDSNIATLRYLEEDGREEANIATFRYLASESGLEIALPEDIPSIERYCVETKNNSLLFALKFGCGMLALKESVSHGEFAATRKRLGLDSAGDDRAMQMAKWFLTRSKEDQQSLLKFKNKSTVLLMAKLPEETYEDISENNQLDEFAGLSHRELRDRLRYAETKNEVLQIDLEAAKSRLMDAPMRTNEWPEAVVNLRQEAAISGNLIREQLDEMERLLALADSNEFHAELDAANPQTARVQYDAGVGMLHQQFCNLANRFQQLHAQFNERDLGYTLETLPPLFKDSELIKIGQSFSVEQSMARAQRELDRSTRINNMRRGKRGRPVGSKKKDS